MSFTIRSYSPNTEKVTYQTFSNYKYALQYANMLKNVGLKASIMINRGNNKWAFLMIHQLKTMYQNI